MFLSPSDMGESGTSHELTLLTHTELGTGSCLNLRRRSPPAKLVPASHHVTSQGERAGLARIASLVS